MKKNINKIIFTALLIALIVCFYLFFKLNDRLSNLKEDLAEVKVENQLLMKASENTIVEINDIKNHQEQLLNSFSEVESKLDNKEDGLEFVYKEGVIHFYISKLSDENFISYYNHDYIWYIAPEALGMIGKQAIPYLMKELKTEDPYEKSMIFYALLLATQDEAVKEFTGDDYLNLNAFDENEYDNNMILIDIWWEKYKVNF